MPVAGAGAAAGAAVAALLGGLLCSPRVQSLLVYLHWLNWPPVEWASPDRPSPEWAQFAGRWLSHLDPQAVAFQGLPGASLFETNGSMGAIRGWRVPRKGPGHRTVLYLHGNAGNIAIGHRVALYELLAQPPLSCDVVAFDYAAFGASAGNWPSEVSAVADASAALRVLASEPGGVVLWGHSLGTGVASGLLAALIEEGAEAALPSGLILEAPFTSVPDVCLSWLSWLPASLTAFLGDLLHRSLSEHRFPTIDRIGDIAQRLKHVAVLHGIWDRVVPHEHGKRVASEAGVSFHAFNRGHDDIVDDPTFVDLVASIFRAWDADAQT